jgi:YD repeat-containing protein
VKVTLPGSGTIPTSYTASSQTTTDPNGKPTTTRFDDFGRVRSIERPFGGRTATTTIGYDRLGRRTSMQDPVQATWASDRPLTQTDAHLRVTTMTYDDVGGIATRQNAAGTTTYTYGESRGGFFNVGRLTTVTFAPSNRPTSTLRFDYDELGRVKRQWPTVDGTTYTATGTWAPGGYHLSTVYQDGETIARRSSTNLGT